MAAKTRFDLYGMTEDDGWVNAGKFATRQDAVQHGKDHLRGVKGVLAFRVIDTKEELAPTEYNCKT